MIRRFAPFAAWGTLLTWLGFELTIRVGSATSNAPSVAQSLEIAAFAWIWFSIWLRKPVTLLQIEPFTLFVVVVSMAALPIGLTLTSAHPNENLAASVLLSGSASLLLWAAIALGGSFAVFPLAISPRTNGPYRFVRHPIYSAYILGSAGWVMLFRDPIVALAAVTEAAALWYRAKAEERVLRGKFAEYKPYMDRVRGRFFPIPRSVSR